MLCGNFCQTSIVCMKRNAAWLVKQRGAMLTHYFNKNGDIDQAKIPNIGVAKATTNRRCNVADLPSCTQKGDPLTNSAYLRGRPLLQQRRVRGGDKYYRFGLPCYYRPTTSSTKATPTNPTLAKLLSREYLVVWSDDSLEFLSRLDMDELLKNTPNSCFSCKFPHETSHGKRTLFACESCFMEWHMECAPDICKEQGMFNIGEVMFCETCLNLLA
jgi:hypothetical protein